MNGARRPKSSRRKTELALAFLPGKTGIWGRTGQDVTACGWVRRSGIEAQKCVSGHHPQTSRKHTLQSVSQSPLGKLHLETRGAERRK